MSGGRSEEIVEAVQLLHALCRPLDAIARQLGIPVSAVRDIIKTGRLPAQQKTLFADDRK